MTSEKPALPTTTAHAARLGLFQATRRPKMLKEPLHKSPTHVLAHACRVRQHPGLCSNLILA